MTDDVPDLSLIGLFGQLGPSIEGPNAADNWEFPQFGSANPRLHSLTKCRPLQANTPMEADRLQFPKSKFPGSGL